MINTPTSAQKLRHMRRLIFDIRYCERYRERTHLPRLKRNLSQYFKIRHSINLDRNGFFEGYEF